jgi:F-type H+-transporting ATPase subunit c
MEASGLNLLAAGISAVGMLGSAIGVGIIFAAFLNGLARNPSVEKKLFTNALIGAALSEAIALLAFVVSMMLMNK